MPSIRSGVRAAFIAVLTVSGTFTAAAQTTGQAEQSAVKQDAGEQHSIEQLRAIVEAIKSCQPLEELSSDIVDPLKEGFADVYGPPLNVVWNVELHPSIRARYLGSIEFSEPSYFKLPPDDDYCNKPKINKSECRSRWVIGTQIYKRQLDHPLQFRYEFDVTSHGLEFLRAFKKTNQTDNEPWVAGSIDSDGCASKAIKPTLNNPNNAAQTLMPATAFASQGRKRDNGQAPQLKSGATVYIEQTTDGFESYLVAAKMEYKVPLVVVADKDKAEYIIKSNVQQIQQAGGGVIGSLLGGSATPSTWLEVSATISLIDSRTSEILFAYSTSKQSSIKNAAQDCVWKLAKFMKKQKK